MENAVIPSEARDLWRPRVNFPSSGWRWSHAPRGLWWTRPAGSTPVTSTDPSGCALGMTLCTLRPGAHAEALRGPSHFELHTSNFRTECGGILLLVMILLLFLEIGIAAAFASALGGLRDARSFAIALRAEGAGEEALADVITGWDPLLNYGVTFPPGSVRQVGPWSLVSGATARAEIRRDMRDLYTATVTVVLVASADTARRALTVLLRMPVSDSLLAGPDTASPPLLDTLRPVMLEHRARWPFQ